MIRADGPMPVSSYMQHCLQDPFEGYYTTGRPLGAEGDFTTAPEISQMFGELIGLALAQAWIDQGRPSPFVLAELGPGRGTLMADILRATENVAGFAANKNVWLIETSPRLRDMQREHLSGYDVHWCDSVDGLPDLPLFAVANEFFDALPIRQFIRQKVGWRERVVGLSNAELSFGLAPAVSLDALEARLADTSAGDVVEVSQASREIANRIGARIGAHGGLAIIVDYGDWRSLGDTFQAIKDHKSANPLATPGRADLTAHVDFEALAAALSPAATTSMTTQGHLLARLGIQARAEALAANMDEPALKEHHSAFHRLTAHDQMGTLFKAIAAYPKGAPVPPGFEG